VADPSHRIHDLLIVGGGINGVGIARDAAGRGLGVLLVEQGDLGGATPSASSKLIHGGLRYLEHGAFRLVREALAEREILLAMAPHLVRPMAFVLPHGPGLRPAWMLQLALWFYDRLGGRRQLAASRRIDLARDPAGQPLHPHFPTGFRYMDCWADDARLAIANAIDARAKGAGILTRARFQGAAVADGHWRVRLREADGRGREVAARALINAAGPWAGEVLACVEGVRAQGRPRLIKGSHLVLPRLHAGADAYLLQNDDGRVVFALPFAERFTLLGTTDIALAGMPDAPSITPVEADYLCRAAGRFFRRVLRPEDAVWSFAGVRPLYDDGRRAAHRVTRDYVLRLDDSAGAPLLTLFGGKLTTYRRSAERVLERLARYFPRSGAPWTATHPLPGGDLPNGLVAFAAELRRLYPGLEPALLDALANRHGARTADVLGDARMPADLGPHFGGGLFAREIEYLMREEWAETADDLLWRRSKLGLALDAAARARLAEAIARMRSGA